MPTLLVFGARNLGRVLATEFAADGWRVAGVARSEETIRVLVEDVPSAVGVIADAAKPDDVERVFRDVGDVDLIVNAITANPAFGGLATGSPLGFAEHDDFWSISHSGRRVAATGKARRGNKWASFLVTESVCAYHCPRHGAVAEWLGRGLQSLVHQFESGRRLSAGKSGPLRGP